MRVNVMAKHKYLTFPWDRGVLLNLQGDCTNLANLMSELKEVKKMINQGANRYNVPFKDLDIKIEFIN